MRNFNERLIYQRITRLRKTDERWSSALEIAAEESNCYPKAKGRRELVITLTRQKHTWEKLTPNKPRVRVKAGSQRNVYQLHFPSACWCLATTSYCSNPVRSLLSTAFLPNILQEEWEWAREMQIEYRFLFSNMKIWVIVEWVLWGDISCLLELMIE